MTTNIAPSRYFFEIYRKEYFKGTSVPGTVIKQVGQPPLPFPEEEKQKLRKLFLEEYPEDAENDNRPDAINLIEIDGNGQKKVICQIYPTTSYISKYHHTKKSGLKDRVKILHRTSHPTKKELKQYKKEIQSFLTQRPKSAAQIARIVLYEKNTTTEEETIICELYHKPSAWKKIIRRLRCYLKPIFSIGEKNKKSSTK